jgi:hypothetical protein
MTSRGLDAIAARDPEASDVFVAALVFPGSQLLVVSAPYPTPAALDTLLAQRQYRDVYSTLQQPSIKAGKIFVQDLGCDGLHGEDGADVDVLYEQGTTQTMFDGNWKTKRLSGRIACPVTSVCSGSPSRLQVLASQRVRFVARPV